jgi:hypothetical protein
MDISGYQNTITLTYGNCKARDKVPSVVASRLLAVLSHEKNSRWLFPMVLRFRDDLWFNLSRIDSLASFA